MKDLMALIIRPFAVWTLLLTLTLTSLPLPLAAQSNQGVWIQIAARPSLLQAQEDARTYAAELPDVAGYSLGGGWYGIVIGPYSRPDAEQALRVYLREGRIPPDSFITFASNFNTRFYPIGADPAPASPPSPAPLPSEAPSESNAQATAAPIATTLPDETPAQARRSEQALSRAERMDLQRALATEGFYTSTIDGAFGRGTRRSMEDWQRANGHQATGVLTTAQRKALMDAFNAPLISAGMARYEDSVSGIALDLPLAMVGFDRHEAPFAQFKPSGSLPEAQVLLISQPGDRRTLYGLYDIMQTLRIVPLDGPRKRDGNRFTIEGRNDRIISHTEARLENGQIKGFTLVWPTGDDARRARVLAAMQTSFARLPGVLDPAAGMDDTLAVDLIAGLDVRRPRLSRSGFFVDASGLVATSADVVQGCERITLDHEYDAEIAFANASGLALLRPTEALAPVAIGEFASASVGRNTRVAVSGFSYAGVLSAPSLSWGTVEATTGLSGEADLTRLQIATQEGDVGGAVLGEDGAILGMLMPAASADTTLPEGVHFALSGASIMAAMEQAGSAPQARSAGGDGGGGALALTALQRKTSGMTTLVSCWE